MLLIKEWGDMCSNTRMVTVHLGASSFTFRNVYMTEKRTESTTITGTVQKSYFVLYLFRWNINTPLEDLNWDAHKAESYVVDADHPSKKYRIIGFKKCFYGSYRMHHIELEME